MLIKEIMNLYALTNNPENLKFQDKESQLQDIEEQNLAAAEKLYWEMRKLLPKEDFLDVMRHVAARYEVNLQRLYQRIEFGHAIV